MNIRLANGLAGLLAPMALAACGGGDQTSPPSDPTPPPSATAPSISTQPVNASSLVGDTATFTVTATGTAPLTYQWQKNGTPIAGATSASYTTPTLQAADDGETFTAVVTNSAGSATSNGAKLSVEPITGGATAPSIATQPVDASGTVGGTATFTVTAAGTAPLTYQWQKNGTAIAGATSAGYTTPTLQAADDGETFTVVVTNSAGSATSNGAKLSVAPNTGGATAPSITIQPVDASGTAGGTATFTVTATGTAPFTYQWQKNGTPIAGATSASYTTPTLQAADDGETFTVVVTNSAGSATSNGAKLSVAPNTGGATAPSIATQPVNASSLVGGTATFTVTAAGTAPLTYQWHKNGTAIAGATNASYTTPALQASDDGATFTVVVTNAAGSATSNGAKLTVVSNTGSAPQPGDVVMYKNDVSRTGQYPLETKLTPANVNSTNFGLLRQMRVDGKVDGQPLYLSQLTIGSAPHNVVYAVTENATVYAFEADTGAQLWQVSLLKSGETAAPPPNACDQITPTIGITTTPVIDRTAGAHGTLYVVAMSFDSTSKYHQRMHALDITTGAELLNGPAEITGASYPNQAGVTTFDPTQYEERTALLLLNGNIYTTWSSHCDEPPYSGWIITFDQVTLAQTSVLNVGPDSGLLPAPDIPPASQKDSTLNGPAIWMSGSGPAADSAGNVYLLTGNGRFESTLDANGFPNHGDYGNSFLKLSKSGSTLKVADYFTQFDGIQASVTDLDLGAGGALLLPDMQDSNGTTKHLIAGAGKDMKLYLVDRDNMGKFSPTTNNIWQQLATTALNGPVRGSPAYFNGTLYYGPRDTTLKAFTFANAKLPTTATSQSVATFGYPGTSPVVSSNGATNGIVWTQHPSGILYAYDATNLAHELYDSRQAPGNRDFTGPRASPGLKFVVPVIANGKVFLGTPNSVAVFGMLH